MAPPPQPANENNTGPPSLPVASAFFLDHFRPSWEASVFALAVLMLVLGALGILVNLVYNCWKLRHLRKKRERARRLARHRRRLGYLSEEISGIGPYSLSLSSGDWETERRGDGSSSVYYPSLSFYDSVSLQGQR